MKTRILIALTLAVALTALVLATWPVVTDAPWEDTGAARAATRCEAALSLRETLTKEGEFHSRWNAGGVKNLHTARMAVGREIDRFC